LKKISVTVMCAIMALAICSCSVSTANLQNVRVSNDKNATASMAVLASDTPEIFVVFDCNNAPDGTVVKVAWKYTESDPAIDIDDASMTLTEVDSKNINFSLTKPDKGWPSGKYEVELFIDDNLQQTVNFSVKDTSKK